MTVESQRWVDRLLQMGHRPEHKDYMCVDAGLSHNQWQQDAARQLVEFSKSKGWTELQFLGAINLLHSNQITYLQLRTELLEDHDRCHLDQIKKTDAWVSRLIKANGLKTENRYP